MSDQNWMKTESIRRISNAETNYTFTVQTGEPAMIAFIRKYAKGIVAGIGYAASIATALGLQHQHYVAVILGVLSTIGVILARNTPSAAPPTRPAAR